MDASESVDVWLNFTLALHCHAGADGIHAFRLAFNQNSVVLSLNEWHAVVSLVLPLKGQARLLGGEAPQGTPECRSALRSYKVAASEGWNRH